jgi:enamine deaminase RidA (YjgF/YER057c/UK114 family)
MTNRQNFTTGGPWEDIIGYCRAVKIGNTIEISGTTATKDEDGNELTTTFDQTKAIIEKLAQVLEDAGASLENVVRTRLYLADIIQWEQAAKAHGLFFKDIKPASTIIEVSRLIDPAMLIEIEMTAVIG